MSGDVTKTKRDTGLIAIEGVQEIIYRMLSWMVTSSAMETKCFVHIASPP